VQLPQKSKKNKRLKKSDWHAKLCLVEQKYPSDVFCVKKAEVYHLETKYEDIHGDCKLCERLHGFISKKLQKLN
jgi:hypothetical protein